MCSQVCLLGAHALRTAAGLPVKLPTRKSWALLAYLSLSAGRDIPREELATLLWPTGGDGQARASLRQEMAVLRKGMSDAGLTPFAADKDTVSLHIAAERVDALHMADLIRTRRTDALRQAVALYGGEFLAGLGVASQPLEDWLLVERQRLRMLVLSAHLILLDIDAAGPDPDKAIATAEALLALDPTQEQGHRALMRLYRRTGRRAEALQQYRRCADALRRELDTEPSQETLALAARIRADVSGPRSRHGAGGGGRAPEFSIRWLAVPEAGPKRRDCTVLVVRLAGPEGSDPLDDPMAFGEAQDRFAARGGRIVTAHGGAILFGTSDRLVGCFDAADAPAGPDKRAIRAAAAIVSEPLTPVAGPPVWAAAGLACGAVALRPAALDPARCDLSGAALLEATWLAARARSGEVLLSRAVYATAGDGIDAVALSEPKASEEQAGGAGLLLRNLTLDAL